VILSEFERIWLKISVSKCVKTDSENRYFGKNNFQKKGHDPTKTSEKAKIADISPKMPQKGENGVQEALYYVNDSNNWHWGFFVGNTAEVQN